MRKEVAVRVKITNEMMQNLKAISEKYDLSISGAIRMLLKLGLGAYEEIQKQKEE